ncbi:MAG: hypothetical protein JWP81_1551 [Ferruginibacter sp.]|nr:hypothetical protein [Ferruginibacter sp.]
MADFKRRTLFLSNGKQIKLFGNSIAIGRSLEIGEGYAPNIFSCIELKPDEIIAPQIIKEVPGEKLSKEKPDKKLSASIANPFRLTTEDLMEIADYNIRLWLDLKDNVRKYGVDNPKIFNTDAVR